MSEPSEKTPKTPLTREERELGMGSDITRRDFLNTVALGTGAALLGMPAPSLRAQWPAEPGVPWHPWTGYAGVGDYAISNGNTWDVVTAGHGIRDGTYEKAIAGAEDTGETHDLAIVGGGFAGAVAAYTFLKEGGKGRSCLLLDNHPIIGGEAKRNEFIVRGQKLIGPQGSNEGAPPTPTTEAWRTELWKDIGLPMEFEFGKLRPGLKPLIFPRTNYQYQLWGDDFESHGFFFDSPSPHWVRNPWGHRLEGTPWSPEVRRDLLRWREERVQPWLGNAESLKTYLDSMTYEQWLTGVRGFHPEVARYVDPIYAAGIGLGSDVLSAYSAYSVALPGFLGLGIDKRMEEHVANHALEPQRGSSFPGGNDGIMRCIVKRLNPEAIEGSPQFPDVHNGRIRFDRMDRAEAPCRLRAGATIVRVDQDPDGPGRGRPAVVTYAKGGRLFSVRAKAVIWCGASWTAKHAITNLPADYHDAMEQFPRSPMLCVNVALNSWRFLYDLGYTACSWRGGFGFSANMRPNMYVGDYRPPLDPDRPNLFTFYVPFNQRGLSLVEQGVAGRGKLFAASYREYEGEARRQMTRMFSAAGFDPARDIAGIVLNRWGHAYCNPGPGFFTGKNGKPPPSDILRRPLGRLAFAHSELNGNQHWPVAAAEGRRAAFQVLEMAKAG